MYRDQPSSEGPLLFVGVGGSVVALDRATGVERWRNDLRGGGLHSTALVATESIVLASASGARLFALDYGSGEVVWQARTSASGRATILLTHDAIYVAKGGQIDCFSTSGDLCWSAPCPGVGMAPAALALIGQSVQADMNT